MTLATTREFIGGFYIGINDVWNILDEMRYLVITLNPT
jgi:hypothetical protein